MAPRHVITGYSIFTCLKLSPCKSTLVWVIKYVYTLNAELSLHKSLRQYGHLRKAQGIVY